MDPETAQTVETDTQAQSILLAASQHNIDSLRTLLRTGSASAQDAETGRTPLHAAIAACEPSSRNDTVSGESHVDNINGAAGGEHSSYAAGTDVEAAARTVRLLLQNGAIWNDVDRNGETPGCLALRLGLKGLYEIMVDAGVRAEILLNRLDEYEQLAGSSSEEEDEGQKSNEEETKDGNVDIPGEGQQRGSHDNNDGEAWAEINNEDYLQSTLRFQDGRILDSARNGVMMAWETDIMSRSADLLAPGPGLRILNIGHGMGIIDTFFQAKEPRAHHIVEAHAGVCERMRKDGWFEKEGNVTVHEGRWQDVVPDIMEQGLLFDAVYFDTFAEDYKALRDFFSDCVLGLLDDGGRFGFFNGLGADRQICYDVYGKVLEMDLFEAGFDTEWETLRVPEMEKGEWEGVKRRYWCLKEYKLPTCQFIG